jgi:hypothetical protein
MKTIFIILLMIPFGNMIKTQKMAKVVYTEKN